MGVVILQILQWILRIIIFLLLLIVGLTAIILIVPIRYRAEGELLEKKPGIQGKITWFFYLIYMKFHYEEEFRMQVRVFGFKVFDSMEGMKKPEKEKTQKRDEDDSQSSLQKEIAETSQKEMIEETAQSILQDKEAKESCSEQEAVKQEDAIPEKEKKTLSEKIDDIKTKIQEIIQKIKDIIAKIQEGKLKVEHYLELWNRDETQITFGRAKTKLGKMIKALLPRKWEVTGEVGFADPCTTGQLMGVLGAMYPILGNKVQIVPNFESEVMNFRGHLKGHIRLGNLLHQIVSLLLNRHCFKFIKMIFDELGGLKQPKDNKE